MKNEITEMFADAIQLDHLTDEQIKIVENIFKEFIYSAAELGRTEKEGKSQGDDFEI